MSLEKAQLKQTLTKEKTENRGKIDKEEAETLKVEIAQLKQALKNDLRENRGCIDKNEAEALKRDIAQLRTFESEQRRIRP
jgi:hypothetical protein